MKRYVVPLLIFLAVALISIMAVAGSSAETPAQKATPGTQDKKTGGEIEAVEQAILEAVFEQREFKLAYLVNQVGFLETRISQDGHWAVSFMALVNPETGEPIPTEPGLAIATKQDKSWRVWLPADPGWAEMVKAAPAEILPPGVKETYLLMNAEFARAPAVGPFGGYLLPWEYGKTVYLSRSVAHDADIPSGNAHYSFDFYVPQTMFDLFAAKAGTVWRVKWDVPNNDHSGTGNYLVLRDTTTSPVTYDLYLHLAQNSIPPELRVQGAAVAQGQFIGMADNTGASSGHHLHFQVHTNPDSYWGASVDVTFDDVDINGGRPRRKDSLYNDEPYCDWPGDVCVAFRSSYVSGNVSPGDTTPPYGDLFEPATGSVFNAPTIHLEGWAMDQESGLDKARFVAFYEDSWHEIGPEFNTLTFSYNWDMCAEDVPDGAVSVALQIWDKEGNPGADFPGLRHFTKDYACTPLPPACVPSASQVAIFSQSDYWGNCTLLDPGNYSSPGALGVVGDDNIESILVGELANATLYEDENFAGRADSLTRDDANLNDNLVSPNRTSSLRVGAKSSAAAAPNELIAPAYEAQFPAGTSLSLSWRPSPRSTQFGAQLIGPMGTVNSGWINNPVWSLDDLTLSEGIYLWRVQARNCPESSCNSAWSSYSTFTILTGSPPPDPVDPPFTDDIESGAGDWTASGLWNRLADGDRARSGSHAWYYGDPGALNYDDGTPNTGDLTSPPIHVPGTGYLLSFWYRYDTESHASRWDQRWVQISENGGPYVNVAQLGDDVMLYDDSSQIWLNKTIDLEEFSGSTIRVRFHFETLDALRNDEAEGWFIDDISVAAGSLPDCGDADNLPANATLIEYGETLEGTMCPAGDIDYFRFVANAGDRIAVDIDTPAEKWPDGLDMNLFLLDDDGQSVLASHDDEVYAVRLDPHLGYQITRAGTYFLKVRLWAHPTYGDPDFTYSLKLIHDEERPQASFVDLPSGSYLSGTTSRTIEVNASDNGSGISRVEFLFHTGDWSQGWQHLGTDVDGQDGWSLTFDPSGLGEQDRLAFFAHVYDWAGNWTSASAWDLTIDQIPPVTALDPLAAAQESTAISVKWKGSDNLSGIGHYDLQSRLNSASWVDYSPDPEGTTQRIWFIADPGTQVGFRLRGVDRAGNVEAYPSSAETTTTIPSADILCSKPDNWDISQGSNDNSFASAVSVVVDAPQQTHNFCNPATANRTGDQDWSTFSVQLGKVYTISAHPLTAMTGVKLELYAADGTTLLASEMPLNLGNPSAMLWPADRNGRIYVRASSLDGRIIGNIVAYRLIVSDSGDAYLPIIRR